MILHSFQAEHNAVFIVAEKLKENEIEPKDAHELISETIQIHFRDEEQILFPVMEPKLPETVNKLRLGHRQIRQKFESLTDPLDKNGLMQILNMMMNHCQDEEEHLFDAAEDLLGQETLRQLQGRRKECSCCGYYA